jgi:hypothetical protein
LEITKYLWFKSVEKMREKFKTRRNSGENVIVVGPTTNTPMEKESCGSSSFSASHQFHRYAGCNFLRS